MPTRAPSSDPSRFTPPRPHSAPAGAAPEPPDSSRDRRLPGIPALVATLLVATLGLLPITNWIPGGYFVEWYGSQMEYQITGSLIVAGIALVLTILSGRIAVLWRPHALDPLAQRVSAHPVATLSLLWLISLALYATLARLLFDGQPLLIDEIAQVFQAGIFAEGRLWRPVARFQEFFSSLHVIDTDGRVYSQFPPGWPAMLAPLWKIGAAWLAGPLSGATAVVAFGVLVRRIEPRRTVALGATVLFALTPFMAFMSGSHMNHTPTLMWLVISMAALASVTTAESPKPLAAFICGLGLGCAATIRPVDAIAFALPAGAWLLWRAVREPRRWLDALPSGLGVALPILLMMWVNVHTTGSPLLFGYQVLWGHGHDLGFHKAPWGLEHTPTRGLELLNLYFLRLQSFLYETPVPSLLPPVAALLLGRRLSSFDRYLLATAGALVGLYWAYWHDGMFLGPRFLFCMLPLLVLWTARLPALVRERWGRGTPVHRATVYGLAAAGAMALVLQLPTRAEQYRAGFASQRWNVDREAAAAGVRNAIVFVRESWESQLVVRMWALGITRPQGEALYRFIDACTLDRTLESLERRSVHGADAYRVLQSLMRDSARVQTYKLKSGVNLRVLPGAPVTPLCAARYAADTSGVVPLAPLLLARENGNIYARDLHARDTLLIQQYPDRPLYLLRPVSTEASARPEFVRLSPDSLARAWRSERHSTAANAEGSR